MERERRKMRKGREKSGGEGLTRILICGGLESRREKGDNLKGRMEGEEPKGGELRTARGKGGRMESSGRGCGTCRVERVERES